MIERATKTMPDLGLGRLIRVFAVLAIVFVLALAVAPARSYFTEWRAVQERYNAAAAAAGQLPIEPAIQQIWNPRLGIVDRCTSCHVGMGPADPLAGGEPLFAAHPAIPHDPAELGCTLCHGGQGRATKAAAAHGNVKHWFEPMLARAELEAGCGSCHSAIPVGAIETAARGRALFERYDCLACHRVDGRGGTKVRALAGIAPDLSGAGLRQLPPDWHERHIEKAAADPAGPFAAAYGPIELDERAAIEEYLRTLAAAPRLAEGKRLFHALGCRGCHKVNGVGGEDGPDLTEIGKQASKDRAWHVAHLRSPAALVAGSAMPDFSIAKAEAEAIALYLRSLRKVDVPAAYWPPDRVRTEQLGEREFGTDGRTLFLVFCAACHGERGEGRRFGELGQAFPAVANPDFLALASDDFLRATLERGRPGRRMPAWGAMTSGLARREVEAIIRWLRSREPAPPSFGDVAAAAREADPDLGRRTYARECATCHGPSGEGAIGPAHRGPEFRAKLDDRFIYDTLVNGRPGTAMGRFRDLDARTLAALIAHVRSLAATDGPTRRLGPGDAARGAALYARSCAGCHGTKGEGKEAPALANPAFLATATDGYLAATIVRGRRGTAMPRFEDDQPGFAGLSADEVQDVVAFIRTLGNGKP